MPNIGTLKVRRSVVDAFRRTYSWTVTFDADVGPLPALGKIDAGLHGATLAIDGTATVGALPVGANYCGGGTKPACPIVNVTAGSGLAFRHVLYGLVPAQLYYVRVSAFNAMGFGTRRPTTPGSMMVPKQLPGVVTSFFSTKMKPELRVASPSSLVVQFGPPVSDGGDPISQYKIEWDTSPSFKSGADDKPLFHDYRDVGAELGLSCIASWTMVPKRTVAC